MITFLPKNSRLGPPLKVAGLFFGMALAFELGLRFNDRIQNQTQSHQTTDNQITLAAFGDSIIVRFPTFVANKLNSKLSSNRDPRHVHVVNAFKPSAQGDEYPQALKQILTTHNPDILLVTLPGSEYIVPTYDESFPRNLIHSRSLLVRAIYLKVYPKLQKLIDFIQPQTISQTRLASLSEELVYRACCGQLGKETTDRLLAEIEHASDLQRQSLDFIIARYAIALLRKESDESEQSLSSIRTILLSNTGSEDRARIPAIEELEAFAWLRFNNSTQAIDRLQKRLSAKTISELGCLSLIHSLWRTDITVEDRTIKACNALYDKSDRVAYHQIDYYIRHSQHRQIAAFVKNLEQRTHTIDRVARATIHSALGQYFHNRKNFRKSKLHFEQAIVFNHRNNSLYRRYLATLTELQKQQLPLTIPENVADRLQQQEDLGNLKFIKSPAMPLPLNIKNSVGLFSPPENSTTSSFTRRIDYPADYFSAFDSLCTAGVTTVILNLPGQRIEPIQEALQRIPCLHYVDTRSALSLGATQKGVAREQLIQEDGFHLSLIGDQIVAEAVCNKLKVISPSSFAEADCTAPSEP